MHSVKENNQHSSELETGSQGKVNLCELISIRLKLVVDCFAPDLDCTHSRLKRLPYFHLTVNLTARFIEFKLT